LSCFFNVTSTTEIYTLSLHDALPILTVQDLERLPENHHLQLPNSVVEMFSGSLGEPEGGCPPKLQRIILRGAEPKRGRPGEHIPDRKSTRLNSSHDQISYAVFCLKKK